MKRERERIKEEGKEKENKTTIWVEGWKGLERGRQREIRCKKRGSSERRRKTEWVER